MDRYYDPYNTPRLRYQNDIQFKSLVDMLTAQIHQCNYTPSELREAVVLACINYEQHNIRSFTITEDDAAVIQGLEAIERFVNKPINHEDPEE